MSLLAEVCHNRVCRTQSKDDPERNVNYANCRVGRVGQEQRRGHCEKDNSPNPSHEYVLRLIAHAGILPAGRRGREWGTCAVTSEHAAKLGTKWLLQVVSQQVQHAVSQISKFGAKIDEYLGSDPVFLAHQAQQEMLSAHVILVEVAGFQS
jgi:hypothetical protein